jgi:hypothetical protein
LVCGVLHHLDSLVWIHKRNGLDGVASNYFSFMYGLVWFWGGSQTIGSLIGCRQFPGIVKAGTLFPLLKKSHLVLHSIAPVLNCLSF